MDFNFSEAEKMIRDGVAEFAAEKVRPEAAEIDRSGEFPRKLVKDMGALGYLGLPYPAKYGGGGAGYTGWALALEEIGRVSATLETIVAVGTTPQEAVWLYGNEEQKKRLLGPLAAGEGLGCIMFTEAETGSDPRLIKTTARLQKDGGYIISGHKQFAANSPAATCGLIFARNETGKLDAFVVDMSTAGIDKRTPFETMGMRGLGAAEVFLDEVKVPAENRLGKPGDGYDILLDAISLERLGVAIGAAAMSAEALELSVNYAKQRQALGGPIMKLPTIQWNLAEMSVRAEAARWLGYRVAFQRQQGENIRIPSAQAKLFATRTAVEVTGMGMQVHGAYGTVKDLAIERLYRDAKIAEIFVGVAEIQRVIVASGLR